MTAEMITVSVVKLVDIFWMGRVGAEALAVVSVTGTLIWTLNSVGMGLGVGAMAIVSRRIGERDSAAVNQAVLQALILGVVVSVTVGAIGFLFAEQMLALLGAEAEVIVLGGAYLRIYFTAFFTLTLLFLINAMLRGAGSAATAFKILALVTLVNIVIEPFLIFGLGPLPPLGVRGSALAAVLSQVIGISIQFYLLLTGRLRIRIPLEKIGLNLQVMRNMVSIGLPSMVQSFSRTASRLVIVAIVALFGTTTLAGYGIAYQLGLMVLIPANGLANAAATMVGQNLGAGQSDRAEKAGWLSAAYVVIVMATVGVIFVIFADKIVGIFTDDPVVLEAGTLTLRVLAAGYFVAALGICMGRALDGAGNTFPPMLINAFTLWGLMLPLAYWLSTVVAWGPLGIWVSVVAANAINAILMSTWFKMGRWKLRQV
jgi:putative MATE family efflux protein